MVTEFGELMECEPMMKTTKLDSWKSLAASLLAILATSCNARTIVDESAKPLAGVHVVAYYRAEGMYFYGESYQCVRVEARVTASDGEFDFPFFSGNFNPLMPKRTKEIGYFKPGYELIPNQDVFADPVKMRPFSGDMTRRFAPGFGGDYNVLNPQADCPQLGRKLYPLLQAIHQDAKLLAKTYEERSRVIDFEYYLETFQKEAVDGRLPYDKAAADRSGETRRQLRNEMGVTK